MNFTKEELQRAVQYKTSRSGGKGGQNVNKVASKVELLFSVADSALFNEDEKATLLSKLQARLNKDGLLRIMCQQERSQYLNKEKAVEKLQAILAKALHKPKKRKASKPSKSSVAARLDDKRRASLKKMNRRISGND